MKSPIILYEPPKRARTDYRTGLSAWTDKSLLDEGMFYPRKTMTAEERLWWYSRFFDVVEVNSSFYAIPSGARELAATGSCGVIEELEERRSASKTKPKRSRRNAA